MDVPNSSTLGDLLEEMANLYPNHEAVVFDDERISYKSLLQQVRGLAKGLIALGVKPGDKVAGLIQNCPSWIVSNLASVYIGCVFVGINTWSRPRELEYLLKHSDTSILIMTERFLKNNYKESLLEICPELSEYREERNISATLPDLREVVTLDNSDDWGAITFEEICNNGQKISDEELEKCHQSVSGDDPANIIYTSGSTSFPKGVVLNHRGLIENGFNIGERQHMTHEDRVWFANPIFFSFGCANALMATLTHGATFVLQELFEPKRSLELISHERCTVYYATPNMTISLYDCPERSRYDLSSLRTGATLGTPSNIKMTMELGPRYICNVYGLTETYGNCAVTDADDPLEVRLHSQGKPLPGNEIKIVDTETGRELKNGEMGEIRVKGFVLKEYYKNTEMNLRTFDENGFFKTGDLGWLDEEGRVHWHARIKEMIKTGGINVSPLEVEEVLYSHPLIQQAYVVGLPDSTRDEIVGAFIEIKQGYTLNAKDIIMYCQKKLASYKVPRYVEFRANNEFPLTATGKIRRAGLREEYEKGQAI